MKLPNHLNLMYKTDSVDTQVTDSSRVLRSIGREINEKAVICSVLQTWIREAIKTEIKKKYILSHEYEKIVDDAAKLQNENEYKQKMVVRKLIKILKMQHYHDALKNARANPKDTWNLQRQLVPGKSKQNKPNFQNPTITASIFNNLF